MTRQDKPVALITGAARRIGREIACHLVEQGWRVLLHTRSSSLDALIDELNSGKPVQVAAGVSAELADLAEITTLAEVGTGVYGRIDALINNASEFYPTPVEAMTASDWNRLFASNASGPLWLSQALLPELRRQRGNIINLIDIHAEKPLKNHTIYCMAKAALRMMTLSLARELAPQIRVNGVSPGAILWPNEDTSSDSMTDAVKQEILDRVPLERPGDPSDIAQAVAYLLNADYVTGQILAVDGGRTLSM